MKTYPCFAAYFSTMILENEKWNINFSKPIKESFAWKSSWYHIQDRSLFPLFGNRTNI